MKKEYKPDGWWPVFWAATVTTFTFIAAFIAIILPHGFFNGEGQGAPRTMALFVTLIILNIILWWNASMKTNFWSI